MTMDEVKAPEPRVLELDRSGLYELGLALSLQALDRCGLPEPTYGTEHAYFAKGNDGWGLRGFYRDGEVYVNLPRSALATRTPGYAWSFPGYKADLTPVGVVAHETGHHVDDVTGRRPLGYGWRNEERVSGYEPNRAESFAEAFRLFVTNPDMLRAGRPARWAHLTEGLGLVPGPLTPWDEVLAERGAHARFLVAAKNWVARGAR